MRFAEALAELDARQPERIVPGLERIGALVDLMDHPERTYPSVHVAGTNGKTTTTRLIGRILCAHGLSSGVYTSPHLHSIAERLALCDDPIGEGEFAETYAHLLPYLQDVDRRGERVTYFEVLTALAFLWFADKPVEAAVFEVGMGGRWDATNVVEAGVAVLCPVGLDHPELGSTVAEVAGEKAAIVKQEAVAVVREQPPEALEVIRNRAEEVGAQLRMEGRDFSVQNRALALGGQLISVQGSETSYEDLLFPLYGEHQARNAAAAVAACEAFLGRALHPDLLREAFTGATSPGRMEVVSRQPLTLLDGAHNPDGARALAAAVGESFVWNRLHLVIGVLSTKDVDGIVGALASRADIAYACSNSSHLSLPADTTADACRRAGPEARAYPTVGDALDAAEAAAADDDLILVTGSLYTVADARPRYIEQE
jgi:dihydrofolate synthase / folylpolyglutamate synthase